MRTALTVIGHQILAEDAARAGLRRRLRRRLTREPGHLLLHPLWVARVEVIADRPPFAPLVRPRLIFVDAVSEYRGLLEALPPTRPVTVQVDDPRAEEAAPGRAWAWMGNERVAVHRSTVDQPRALELVQDVQVSQINRSYALRKPRHRVVDVREQHLPLWCFGTSTGPDATVNAVTGVDEAYLASRWC